MLLSLDAPYAHETLPKGSGSITGMVAKVKLTNFDISESRLCILPLHREDINISDINEITSVLVEWDCNVPDWKEIGASTFTSIIRQAARHRRRMLFLAKTEINISSKPMQTTFWDSRMISGRVITLTPPMDIMVVCEEECF